jgi:hypothetical protein
MVIEPSRFWWFSHSGTRMRGQAATVLFSVWQKRTVPAASGGVD